MSKPSVTTLLVTTLMALPAAAPAATSDHESHHAAPTPDNAQILTAGEVRKVDPDTKKITIRHGPIENLGMPPMTMVFQVRDPALLSQVKAGDKVRFHAENLGGALTVTQLERE